MRTVFVFLKNIYFVEEWGLQQRQWGGQLVFLCSEPGWEKQNNDNVVRDNNSDVENDEDNVNDYDNVIEFFLKTQVLKMHKATTYEKFRFLQCKEMRQ